jgi:hypothetical protein
MTDINIHTAYTHILTLGTVKTGHACYVLLFRNTLQHNIIPGSNNIHKLRTDVPDYVNPETKKLRGLDPRANYTDQATVTCWRS